MDSKAVGDLKNLNLKRSDVRKEIRKARQTQHQKSGRRLRPRIRTSAVNCPDAHTNKHGIFRMRSHCIPLSVAAFLVCRNDEAAENPSSSKVPVRSCPVIAWIQAYWWKENLRWFVRGISRHAHSSTTLLVPELLIPYQHQQASGVATYVTLRAHFSSLLVHCH